MAPPPVKRIKTLSVTRPILYGNVSKKLGDVRPPNAPTEHTHLWTIFVKGPNNEDISYFIKKVVFKLHDTYPNPIRSVESPPFEITETGWGEFEINVKIYFIEEANEKVVSFYHHLRLHPYDLSGKVPKVLPQKPEEEISSVIYDELVFNEPNETFFAKLMSVPGNKLPNNKTDECVFSRQLEDEELVRIDKAIGTVESEIAELKDKIQTHLENTKNGE